MLLSHDGNVEVNAAWAIVTMLAMDPTPLEMINSLAEGRTETP